MTTPTLHIAQLTEATPEMAADLEALMEHLTTAVRPHIDVERLEVIVSNPHSALFVARLEGEIVGSLTATHYTTPTSEKVWIEDVVVAPSARGRGAGRALVEEALCWRSKHHPQATIYLTSNPTRTAARNLYKALGFEEYSTGVFKLK